MSRPLVLFLLAVTLAGTAPLAAQPAPTAPAAGGVTNSPGPVTSEQEAATIEQKMLRLRSELEQVSTELQQGNEALQSYDAFTKALSASRAAEEAARAACLDLKKIVEEGGPFVERNRRRYEQCLDAAGVSTGINARANQMLGKIERDLIEIKKMIDYAGRQKDALDKEHEALNTGRALLKRLQGQLDINKRILGGGS